MCNLASGMVTWGTSANVDPPPLPDAHGSHGPGFLDL